MARKRESEQKPKPFWLNQKNAAASCRMTVTAFHKLNVEPVARIGREVYYDAFSIKEAYQARWEAQQAKAATRPDPVDLEKARIENLNAETRLKVLKEAQLQRELAPIGLLTGVLSKVGARISAILETIPGKVKRRAPRLTAAEIEVIKKEIVKAQNAAAQVNIELDEFTNSAADPEGDSPRSEVA